MKASNLFHKSGYQVIVLNSFLSQHISAVSVLGTAFKGGMTSHPRQHGGSKQEI
jgi:hypothetical protein